MRNLIVILVFLVLPMFWSVQAQPTSQFGRYTGVLSHSKLAQEQLAKLDFVVEKQSAAEFKLIGILSVYFGGFDSTEYVTYHFNEVTYNVLTGGLVFDQPDQGISVVVTEFSSGVLKGRLRSNTLGDVGELLLSTKLNVQPTKPLVQMVWESIRELVTVFKRFFKSKRHVPAMIVFEWETHLVLLTYPLNLLRSIQREAYVKQVIFVSSEHTIKVAMISLVGN